ncbi:MAG: polysaccharide biosynthesis protein [Oscillospiraceae bacterium]|nr:polysaccharide biosynthesis protein [Oscillospiraceae bacterium]
MLKGKTNQKQTFLGGAAVLALATAIVKLLGAFYKIPLKRLIGDEGFGYFNTAYDIYSVLLMVSTTGLPVAMSRMISEAKTLGRTNQIQRIFQVSRKVFLVLGVVGTVGMSALCRQLAGVMNHENSWFAILCLSPAVLFICLISAERGFFQGQSNMVPTSVSQVMEAVCKLVVGLSLAYILNKTTGEMSKAAGGAILGVTLGTVISTVYLILRRKKAAALLHVECLDPSMDSQRDTVKKLIAIAAPITLGAAGLQIITTIDTAVYMGQLKGAAGFSEDVADKLKGIYNFAQTIFNLPCAFVTPIIVSAIPAITEQLTLRKTQRANTIAESATRVMGLITMPCSIGLAVLSEPVMQLLGGYTADGSLGTASILMRILAFCVFFNSFVLVMNAILQAHGYVFLPVINMVIGGIVKVLVNLVLVGNAKINIVGVPVGTVICYMVITMLDLVAIQRVLKHPPKLMVNVFKPALAALAMGVAAFLLNHLSMKIGLPLVLRTGVSILGAGVVYALLVVYLRVITRADCSLLPKGDKIAKLLRIP